MANLFEPPRYIAVEGPIRVGKSTLCQVIAETLHAQRITEPERNPFLRSFYDGEHGAAFQAQFAFLIARYEQLGSLDVKRNPNKTYVADYIFEKDKLFACLNLGDAELEVYNRYYELFRQNVPTPDPNHRKSGGHRRLDRRHRSAPRAAGSSARRRARDCHRAAHAGSIHPGVCQPSGQPVPDFRERGGDQRYRAARTRAGGSWQSPYAPQAKRRAILRGHQGWTAGLPAPSLGGCAVSFRGALRGTERGGRDHDRDGRRWRPRDARNERGRGSHHRSGRSHVRGIWNAKRGDQTGRRG